MLAVVNVLDKGEGWCLFDVGGGMTCRFDAEGVLVTVRCENAAFAMRLTIPQVTAINYLSTMGIQAAKEQGGE